MSKDIFLPYFYVFFIGSIIFFYGIYMGFKYGELSLKDSRRKDFFLLLFILLFYMVFQGFFQFIAPKI